MTQQQLLHQQPQLRLQQRIKIYLINSLFLKINFKKSGFFLATLFLFLILSNLVLAYNETKVTSRNLYGVPGLVDMPVAGSFRDGELNFSSSKTDKNLRNTIGFQALPFVYGAFRYSGIGDKQNYYIDSGYTTWDRSFDLRLDLLKEKKFMPDVTLGFQDIIGTGIYSTEYLVASKSFFETFRTSLGLGWGRLGTGNQLRKNSLRPQNTGGKKGGLLRYKQLFKGDIGLFGGVEYLTPLEKLKLKIEISSDTYEDESYLINALPSSQINYGLDYELFNNISLSGYCVYGNQLGFQVNISANPLYDKTSSFMEGVPQPFYSIPIEYNEDHNFWENIIADLKQEKITVIGYKQSTDEVVVVIENFHFTTHTQAYGRTLRILSRHVPISKNIFTVVFSEVGLPISKISIDRNEVSSIVDAPNAELLTFEITAIEDASKYIEDIKLSDSKKFKINWSLSPYYRLHLFDPSKPLYHDFGLKLNFSNNPKPGIIFAGTIEESLVTNFDDIWRGKKGKLAKVRTDLKNYLNVVDTRIRNLQGSSYYKLSNNMYGRLSLGYFEPMYSGFSSEFLYAPNGSSIAIGSELNYLNAREFRQLFGSRNINGMSKLNGHLSSYWDTGYYNYLVQLDVGRYLAGDDGATLTMTRNFPNGWEMGGFFTITNASFEDFGEGSFDKGLFLKIPFASIVPYETRSELVELMRPIQGDGGARVSMAGRLYPLISSHNKNQLKSSWGKLWR